MLSIKSAFISAYHALTKPRVRTANTTLSRIITIERELVQYRNFVSEIFDKSIGPEESSQRTDHSALETENIKKKMEQKLGITTHEAPDNPVPYDLRSKDFESLPEVIMIDSDSEEEDEPKLMKGSSSSSTKDGKSEKRKHEAPKHIVYVVDSEDSEEDAGSDDDVQIVVEGRPKQLESPQKKKQNPTNPSLMEDLLNL
jgi:hypothetical protein